MAELVLRVGRSGVGKTRKMLEEIRDNTSNTRHIIIIPEQLSHKVERELCGLCGDDISLRAEVLTFSRLCNHIFHHCGGLDDPELDKGGRLLLLHQSVSKCQDRLEVLGHYAQHSTFFEKLMKTVDELKTNRVATEALFQLDPSIPEQKKIHDIALICGFYDSLTLGLGEDQQQNLAEQLGVEGIGQEWKGFDPRDRLSRGADALGDSSWGEGKTFWVDGFTDFTPQQLDMLQHFLSQGEGMTLSLTGDLNQMEEGDSLFSPTFLTINQLKDRAKKENIGVRVEELEQNFPLRQEPLAHLEAHLFHDDLTVFEGEVQGAVRVFSALNPRSEVEWVASEILTLVQEEGHRFRDILVVARDFSAYADHIKSIFPRYQIPVFATEMSSILDKPVISVVHTVFQAMNGFYQTEDMLRFLKTGFATLTLEQVDFVEDYLLSWGEEQWRRAWTKHTKRYDGNISLAYLEELKEAQDPSYESAQKSYDSNKKALDRLNHLRLQALKPLLDLEKAVEQASGKQQCEALYNFLQSLHLYEKMKERQRILEEEGDMAQSQEYKQLWDILCTALEQCHLLLSDEIMDFKEFSKVFLLVLSQYSVGTIPVSLDRVTAGETTRLKSNRCQTVFWLGCEDSVVPLASNAGGLLTDVDRALLTKLEITLNQDSERLLYREMTTAYEICALATEKIYFSYPSRNMAGGSLRPSFLIERIELMYQQVKRESEEDLKGVFRLKSPIPALEQTNSFPFVKELLKEKCPTSVVQLVGSHPRGSLSPFTVDLLYGKDLTLSATALNRLNSCQFAFYLYYGLKARAREKMKFRGAEYGNMVHFVLEKALKNHTNVVGKKEKRLLSEADLDLDGLLEGYLENQLGGRDSKTPRELFLLERMRRYVKDVVTEVMEELNRSDFAYLGGEVKFKRSVEELCGEKPVIPLSFQGSIDRVDGFVEDGQLYLHLVDYKTGTKTLSYGALEEGRDLQLLIYYLALQGKIEEFFPEFTEKLVKKEALPAALSYLPGKTELETGKRDSERRQDSPTGRVHVKHTGMFVEEDFLLEALEEAEGNKFRYVPVSRDKEGCYKAVSDSLVTKSELNLLLNLGKRHLSQVAETLHGGDICANPYYQDDLNQACLYCEFKTACHFQTEEDQQRLVTKRNKFEVIAALKEKGEG